MRGSTLEKTSFMLALIFADFYLETQDVAYLFVDQVKRARKPRLWLYCGVFYSIRVSGQMDRCQLRRHLRIRK